MDYILGGTKMTKTDLWVYSICFAIYHLFFSTSIENSILVFISSTFYIIIFNMLIRKKQHTNSNGDNK